MRTSVRKEWHEVCVLDSQDTVQALVMSEFITGHC